MTIQDNTICPVFAAIDRRESANMAAELVESTAREHCPLSDYMDDAWQHFTNETGYEAVLNFMADHPDVVTKILMCAAGLGDKLDNPDFREDGLIIAKSVFSNFAYDWVDKEAERLQDKAVDLVMHP